MKSKYPECYGTPVCALETLYSKHHKGYLFNYICVHTNHSIKKHKTYNTIQTMLGNSEHMNVYHVISVSYKSSTTTTR